MADLVLEPHIRERLDRVILEQRQRDRLRGQGFQPLHRLLLIGPPGTGKTMTAGALAGDLRLPLFVVRLDGLVAKSMGETTAELRLVFDALKETNGVYLFDDVDALGGARETGNDIGGTRRTRNSFLQFLEQDQSDSLVVATTNHPQLLDRAMFRRFDTVVKYTLPTGGIAKELVRSRLAAVRLEPISWSPVIEAAGGLSHAEIVLSAENAGKDTILSGADVVSTEKLVSALRKQHGEFGR